MHLGQGLGIHYTSTRSAAEMAWETEMVAKADGSRKGCTDAHTARSRTAVMMPAHELNSVYVRKHQHVAKRAVSACLWRTSHGGGTRDAPVPRRKLQCACDEGIQQDTHDVEPIVVGAAVNKRHVCREQLG